MLLAYHDSAILVGVHGGKFGVAGRKSERGAAAYFGVHVGGGSRQARLCRGLLARQALLPLLQLCQPRVRLRPCI